jgi:hypothetical protein
VRLDLHAKPLMAGKYSGNFFAMFIDFDLVLFC